MTRKGEKVKSGSVQKSWNLGPLTQILDPRLAASVLGPMVVLPTKGHGSHGLRPSPKIFG